MWRVREDVNISRLGYGEDIPLRFEKGGCAETDITTYHLTDAALAVAGGLQAPPKLYVRHMTRAEINADPTVTSKPSYTQVYQPALKLGGTGRLINVSDGDICG